MTAPAELLESSCADGVFGVVGSLDAIPALSAGAAPDSLSLDRLTWALLCKADGVRSVRALACECGLSHCEAARTIAALVEQGVLEVVDVVSTDKTGAEDGRDGEAGGLAGVGAPPLRSQRSRPHWPVSAHRACRRTRSPHRPPTATTRSPRPLPG